MRPSFAGLPPLSKKRGGRRARGRNQSVCHASFWDTWRLSARRLGDFASPGPRFLVSVPVSFADRGASSAHRLVAPWPDPEKVGTVPVQQAPCGAVVMPPDRVPGRPECVRARHARGRRPKLHERCNRFASPRGSGEAEYKPRWGDGDKFSRKCDYSPISVGA
jgi:hypothetical protein